MPITKSMRPAAQGLLLALVGSALVVWLLREASWPALYSHAAALPVWAWLLAAAGLGGTYALRAARLRAEWAYREQVPMVDCLRIVLTHNVMLLLLPMRAGEGGYVWQVHRRWGVSLSQAAASLLRLRLQDGCVLLLIATAVLPPWPAPPRLALALSLMVLLSSLLPMLVRFGRRRWDRLDKVARLLLPGGGNASGWVYSVANWSLKLGVLGLMFSALAGTGAADALRAAVGGELAGALPLQAPAGVGTYELGAGLAHAHGAGATAQIVAVALVLHGFSIAVTLAWAAVAHALLPAGGSNRTVSAWR